jgi:hypothetical protein
METLVAKAKSEMLYRDATTAKLTQPSGSGNLEPY